jgi:formylglycine-generating enzyme required for sulfatase activity
MNYAAVDAGATAVEKVAVPAEWANLVIEEAEASVDMSRPEFVRNVVDPINALKGDLLPVNNICWQDAKDFCDELNRFYAGKLPAGYQFALPSEAQWEYAAHAGDDKTPGKQNMADCAWYKDNSQSLQTVGLKKPNNWDIYAVGKDHLLTHIGSPRSWNFPAIFVHRWYIWGYPVIHEDGGGKLRWLGTKYEDSKY